MSLASPLAIRNFRNLWNTERSSFSVGTVGRVLGLRIVKPRSGSSCRRPASRHHRRNVLRVRYAWC